FISNIFEQFRQDLSVEALLNGIRRFTTRYGRMVRQITDAGLALRNFHGGNITFLEGSEFIHDTEDSYWREPLTPEAFFGWTMVCLRDVLVAFRQFDNFAIAAFSQGLPWIMWTLEAYFHDQPNGTDLQNLEPTDVARIVGASPGPLYQQTQHPFIRR